MRTLLLGGILATGLLAAAGPSHAQETGAGAKIQVATDTTSVIQSDSLAFDGTRIDSIVIENRNVFPVEQPGYNNILFRTANHLHIVTRTRVLRRELLFKPGDTFSHQLAEETAHNLRTRYDLYDAWVIPERLPNGNLLVRVITQDQWSLLAGARIKRDANLTYYQLSLEDRNLLGQNQYVSIDYYIQQKDTNYIQAVYADPRFAGYPVSFQLNYGSKPTDKSTELNVAHPYYNLQQQLSYGVDWVDEAGRDDYYLNNQPIAQVHRSGDNFEIFGQYRWGSYSRKIGILADYEYHFQHYYDSVILGAGAIFPQDSVVHLFRVGPSFDKVVYDKVRRVNGFSYTEDVTLGQSVRFLYGRAYSRGLSGYSYDQYTLDGTVGYKVGSNLFLAESEAGIWYQHAEQVRRSVDLSLRYYNTSLPFLTLASRLRYTTDRSERFADGLYLGGATGIRGYDRFFRTGDKIGLANIELRFFPGLELLAVKFGGAIFADVGNIWTRSENINPAGISNSVGVGLRISVEQALKQDIIRIDLARAQAGQWELSFGTGQYF